jgi:hypothetical protein
MTFRPVASVTNVWAPHPVKRPKASMLRGLSPAEAESHLGNSRCGCAARDAARRPRRSWQLHDRGRGAFRRFRTEHGAKVSIRLATITHDVRGASIASFQDGARHKKRRPEALRCCAGKPPRGDKSASPGLRPSPGGALSLQRKRKRRLSVGDALVVGWA